MNPERALVLMSVYCNLNIFGHSFTSVNYGQILLSVFYFFFSVVQECSRPVGDEEEAGGGSSAVYSEGWDTDSGSGSC